MMRRVDLLPAVYAERRRQRQTESVVIVVIAVIAVVLVLLWYKTGQDVTNKNNELQTVQVSNSKLRVEISKLQEFADLDNEVKTKVTALQVAMAGDIDWPSVMTEVAMEVPGEVRLKSMSASAGTTEGAAPVGTETAPVDINAAPTVGRISFTGESLTMPGVAKWLIRVMSVKDFKAAWLNSATKAAASSTGGTTAVSLVSWDSTLELSDTALSQRFQSNAAGGTP